MNSSRGKPKGNPTLVAALKTLKRLQEKHDGVVEASDLKDDEQRILLVETGFLRPVMKGWYICSSPSDNDADTTAWYASFWAFVSGYLGKRFGKRYCLNPETSLMLHTGNTNVPRQVTCARRLSRRGRRFHKRTIMQIWRGWVKKQRPNWMAITKPPAAKSLRGCRKTA